ncbi:MAG: 2-oxoacid:ferredoxin oxidoreductase subunit beta [Chloroflexi bacterium]|nr:2-oxoacid:ferredoxin oxidoreductase subunit beta [Chloroflexota bacterium]
MGLVEAPPRGGKAKTNIIGLARTDYKGGDTTLCAGCGHNSISSQIVNACFEAGIQPEQVVKLSGIGCSSKSPAYFLNRSSGFNTLHGRMPAVATGATTVNRKLVAIGVSGDGDTGSIGLGQFKHMVRRNVPMVYIIENNGVYGLTKGQFSATADIGQELKYAGQNELPPIDLCLEALVAECGFVARSFAGDPKQVMALLMAALVYEGTAVIDIISPCVTFNNHDESTKSYVWGKEHDERLHDITYVPARETIQVDYEPGEVKVVEMHDGSHLRLKKLGPDYDPTHRQEAIRLLDTARTEQLFFTGLLFLNEGRPTLPQVLRLPETPLVQLPPEKLRPSPESLAKLMASLQ